MFFSLNRLNNCSQELLRLQRQAVLQDCMICIAVHTPANIVPHSLQLRIRLCSNPPFILYQYGPMCGLCQHIVWVTVSRYLRMYGKISRLCSPSRILYALMCPGCNIPHGRLVSSPADLLNKRQFDIQPDISSFAYMR